MAVSAEVATLFLEEMARRNIPVQLNEKGEYVVECNELKKTISLENISRDFGEDRDPGKITRFVDVITRQIIVPEWKEASPGIRWALEPGDMPLNDALYDKISNQVAKVLVYVSPDEMEIMWVSESIAASWGQTKESLLEVAQKNMQAILKKAHVEPLDGVERLAALNTKCTAFKAALVFASGLKKLAEPVLGWPILAVLPCRDFVYLFTKQDDELFTKIGGITLQQYDEGGYPLCTEIFEISDDGVQPIGAFQKGPQPESDELDEDEDGMRTIRYLDGEITFRIPAHWVDEFDEENGGTYYDEDEDNGTLRLSTILATSKKPVTTHTAREMAEKNAQRENGSLVDLGNGNWLNIYDKPYDATDDDEAITIRYWEIVNPIPPNHIRIAIFSYTATTEQIENEDGEVLDALETMDREIRACQFHR